MSGPVEYSLGAELGRGALGRVVRVHRPGQPDLAGKILHASHQADAKALARFEGEAALLAELRHPNIVAVEGLREIDGDRALLMELVEGKSLAAEIAWHVSFAEARVAAIGRGIADGLSAAHHAGLVHRDLKPDNVLLGPGDVPKLVDFGMARATSFAGVDPNAFAIVGTPDYMAPESIDPLAVDARADLYSLGCILFEMLTGSPPFTGATAFAVLEAHRNEPIPALPETGCSSAMAQLVQSLLAKSPADRPQSAAAVRDTLATLSDARLAPRGEHTVVRGGQCASCGEPAVAEVPVCFGCGLAQATLERGAWTVFVTGPGKTTHKIDSALRDRLLEWLESNPALGLSPQSMTKKLPRLPFVITTAVSERSARSLLMSLESLGIEGKIAEGGRYALPEMRTKSWKLGGRFMFIGLGGLWWGIHSFGGLLILPALGVGAVGTLAAGWVVSGKPATRRTGKALTALPAEIAEPLDRIVGAVPAITERRHRESLRAVVQRVLAVRERAPNTERAERDADLGRVLDLALVATTRIDELEATLAQRDLRDASSDTRAQMRERDSWAARLLELTAFLDALAARYAAAAVEPDRSGSLDELRAHIEALEEVQAL